MDIESTYHLVPLHLQDCSLQAVQWEGSVYFDLMLLFGLRSTPKIFNALADALEWYVHQQGIQQVLHYLDDLIVVAPPPVPVNVGKQWPS